MRVDGVGRSARRPALTHVAFDLDGTLVDSRADLTAACNHVLHGFGLPMVAPETVSGFVGDGARTLVRRALGPERAALVDEGVARFLAYYRLHLLDATRLYPGIAAALEALQARGVILSVVTNKAEGLSREILAGLGVLDRIHTLVGGDSLSTRKPDPAGLEAVLAASGTDRTRFVLVGDSPIDQATAQAAGVAFCGVTWGLAPGRWRPGNPRQVVIDDAAALVLLVERGFVCAGAGAA